jgi:lipopolysaccharide biosynthesis glycosyltransferase
MIKVFIGFDQREVVGYNVLSHSLNANSSKPVSITPLALNQLGDVFTRKRDPLQSTDFSMSRFLVPYLCNYEGWAIFMDCDMLLLDDLAKLWDMRDDDYAVMVAKHDYIPKEATKFLNSTQTKYEKKNWSSVMLFNNSKCRALTPEYVNTATGLQLHQFKWLQSDDLIGEIPKAWNFLVGEYSAEGVNPSLVHYTIGGPYFKEYRDCDFSDEWRNMLRNMLDSNGNTILPETNSREKEERVPVAG